ncbi:hypothetical protein K1T71_012705 [Dendrolimus kikuchii]|uniref:Uncharacterized protein n=1 Tax=Dendrolimus kikuchii TaxID=765133 RepID=A0ACC1CKD7_9NEOP|nr:hypothetical protein K1T71_012705 [Dendrolimus kikuchii]
MLWEPVNLTKVCPANTNLTACSPFGYAYLELLVRLYSNSSDRYPCREDREWEVYDFIVVGAGSAGCIVANRLSAIWDYKVLLLEAGPEEPDVTKPPALEYACLGSKVDWQYSTQPDGRSCLSRVGKRCPWPRGKTMGGSSSVNSLSYVRGNRLDYDTWARLGNYGWSFKEVLPYFKKSERNLNIKSLSREYHGTKGEQPVSSLPYIDKPTVMLINGMKELGLPERDFNGEHQTGTYNSQSFTENGERVSNNHAFIKPIVKKRKNLVVKTNAEVTKILINRRKQAYGVKYIRNGKELMAKANKEVIITAGVIGSPKLLLLSGIGPADDLKSAGIEVIQDLDVGKNLHDHVTYEGLLISIPEYDAVSNDEMLNHIMEYANGSRKNPIAADGVGKAMGFIKTDKNLSAPDIQYQFQCIRLEEFIKNIVDYNRINMFPASCYNATGIVIRVTNLITKSRGYLKLNETHPHDKPIIVANYLENSDDLELLVRGTEFIRALEHTETFKKAGAKFYKETLKPCKGYEWSSKDYTICLSRHYTASPYHPVGSCKMGPASDKTAVVDPKLRVYGVKRLRVMDSAAIPIVPRGNTNAPAMLMGEKGVDFVMDYWWRKIP